MNCYADGSWKDHGTSKCQTICYAPWSWTSVHVDFTICYLGKLLYFTQQGFSWNFRPFVRENFPYCRQLGWGRGGCSDTLRVDTWAQKNQPCNVSKYTIVSWIRHGISKKNGQILQVFTKVCIDSAQFLYMYCLYYSLEVEPLGPWNFTIPKGK